MTRDDEHLALRLWHYTFTNTLVQIYQACGYAVELAHGNERIRWDAE